MRRSNCGDTCLFKNPSGPELHHQLSDQRTLWYTGIFCFYFRIFHLQHTMLSNPLMLRESESIHEVDDEIAIAIHYALGDELLFHLTDRRG